MAYPSTDMKNQRIAFYVLVLVGAVGMYTTMQALQVQRACFEKARKCESGRFLLVYEDHLWNAACTVTCLCEEHDSTLQTTTNFYRDMWCDYERDEEQRWPGYPSAAGITRLALR